MENEKNTSDASSDPATPLNIDEIRSASQFCYVRGNDKSPIRRIAPKIKRNDLCPNDSSKKFKNCCGKSGINHCAKLLFDYLDRSINKK